MSFSQLHMAAGSAWHSLACRWITPIFASFFFKKVFIYLFGCVRYYLKHVGSFIVTCGSLSSCGMQAQLPCSMWDFSSLTGNQTCIPCIRRQTPNHWTAREGLCFLLYLVFLPLSLCVFFCLSALLGHWVQGPPRLSRMISFCDT